MSFVPVEFIHSKLDQRTYRAMLLEQACYYCQHTIIECYMPEDITTFGLHPILPTMAALHNIVAARHSITETGSAVQLIKFIQSRIANPTYELQRLYVDILVELKMKAVFYEVFASYNGSARSEQKHAALSKYFDLDCMEQSCSMLDTQECTSFGEYSLAMDSGAYHTIRNILFSESMSRDYQQRHFFNQDSNRDMWKKLSDQVEEYVMEVRKTLPPPQLIKIYMNRKYAKEPIASTATLNKLSMRHPLVCVPRLPVRRPPRTVVSSSSSSAEESSSENSELHVTRRGRRPKTKKIEIESSSDSNTEDSRVWSRQTGREPKHSPQTSESEESSYDGESRVSNGKESQLMIIDNDDTPLLAMCCEPLGEFVVSESSSGKESNGGGSSETEEETARDNSLRQDEDWDNDESEDGGEGDRGDDVGGSEDNSGKGDHRCEGDGRDRGEGDGRYGGEGDRRDSGEGDRGGGADNVSGSEDDSGKGDRRDGGEGERMDRGEGDHRDGGEGDRRDGGKGGRRDGGEGDSRDGGEGDDWWRVNDNWDHDENDHQDGGDCELSLPCLRDDENPVDWENWEEHEEYESDERPAGASPSLLSTPHRPTVNSCQPDPKEVRVTHSTARLKGLLPPKANIGDHSSTNTPGKHETPGTDSTPAADGVGMAVDEVPQISSKHWSGASRVSCTLAATIATSQANSEPPSTAVDATHMAPTSTGVSHTHTQHDSGSVPETPSPLSSLDATVMRAAELPQVGSLCAEGASSPVVRYPMMSVTRSRDGPVGLYQEATPSRYSQAWGQKKSGRLQENPLHAPLLTPVEEEQRKKVSRTHPLTPLHPMGQDLLAGGSLKRGRPHPVLSSTDPRLNFLRQNRGRDCFNLPAQLSANSESTLTKEKRKRARPRKQSSFNPPAQLFTDSGQSLDDAMPKKKKVRGRYRKRSLDPLAQPSTQSLRNMPTEEKQKRGKPGKDPMPLSSASGNAALLSSERIRRKRGRPRKQLTAASDGSLCSLSPEANEKKVKLQKHVESPAADSPTHPMRVKRKVRRPRVNPMPSPPPEASTERVIGQPPEDGVPEESCGTLPSTVLTPIGGMSLALLSAVPALAEESNQEVVVEIETSGSPTPAVSNAVTVKSQPRMLSPVAMLKTVPSVKVPLLRFNKRNIKVTGTLPKLSEQPVLSFASPEVPMLPAKEKLERRAKVRPSQVRTSARLAASASLAAENSLNYNAMATLLQKCDDVLLEGMQQAILAVQVDRGRSSAASEVEEEQDKEVVSDSTADSDTNVKDSILQELSSTLRHSKPH